MDRPVTLWSDIGAAHDMVMVSKPSIAPLGPNRGASRRAEGAYAHGKRERARGRGREGGVGGVILVSRGALGG